MASRVARFGPRHVKPIISTTPEEARARVISLYKAWYRHIPQMQIDYDILKTTPQCREKLKEEFLKHKDVKDLRIIDLLVHRGQMDLQETVHIWKDNYHLMHYWKPTQQPKPSDFLGKFLDGH